MYFSLSSDSFDFQVASWNTLNLRTKNEEARKGKWHTNKKGEDVYLIHIMCIYLEYINKKEEQIQKLVLYNFKTSIVTIRASKNKTQ